MGNILEVVFRLGFIQGGNRELGQTKEIGPEIILLVVAVTGAWPSCLISSVF